MKHQGTELLLIVLAFGAIYFFWGATYLAVKIAIESVPPFLMAATRFLFASVLLFGLSHLIWKPKLPNKKALLNAAFAGVLFLGVGTGGVAWALQFVDSGVTALIISAQPLLTIFLVWAMLKNPPVASSYIGVVLGIGGMYLLVSQDHVSGNGQSLWGILVIFCSMLAWGYTSILIKKIELPDGQAQSTSIQMFAGSLSLYFVSFFLEDWQAFDVYEVSMDSRWAFGFLVIFGSIVAFSSFNYLLKRISPEKVSTSTYVNPVIAMFVGWWFRNELITTQSVFAAFVMLTGVLFILVDMVAWVRNRKLSTS